MPKRSFRNAFDAAVDRADIEQLAATAKQLQDEVVFRKHLKHNLPYMSDATHDIMRKRSDTSSWLKALLPSAGTERTRPLSVYQTMAADKAKQSWGMLLRDPDGYGPSREDPADYFEFMNFPDAPYRRDRSLYKVPTSVNLATTGKAVRIKRQNKNSWSVKDIMHQLKLGPNQRQLLLSNAELCQMVRERVLKSKQGVRGLVYEMSFLFPGEASVVDDLARIVVTTQPDALRRYMQTDRFRGGLASRPLYAGQPHPLAPLVYTGVPVKHYVPRQVTNWVMGQPNLKRRVTNAKFSIDREQALYLLPEGGTAPTRLAVAKYMTNNKILQLVQRTRNTNGRSNSNSDNNRNYMNRKWRQNVHI